jgi:DNA-directed RNA polymerase specialized sigma24 family protein
MKAAKYVAREQSLTEFLQSNEKSFERMAIYILGRWKAPNDVSVADVVQELRIAAWQYAKKFDPKYGKTPEQYVVWNTINTAKKWVHRQRRGRDDWAPSRFDVLSPTGNNEGEGGVIDAPQETELHRREQLRLLLDRCTSASAAICLMVFFQAESAEGAARAIMQSDNLRRLCGVTTEKDAARMVRKTVKDQAACQQG